jgi:hypothetical protein
MQCLEPNQARRLGSGGYPVQAIDSHSDVLARARFDGDPQSLDDRLLPVSKDIRVRVPALALVTQAIDLRVGPSRVRTLRMATVW